MKESVKKYNIYPEISRGNQISSTLRTKAAQMKNRLTAQPKMTVPRSLPPTSRQAYSFWGNMLGNKTTTTIPTSTKASSKTTPFIALVTRVSTQQKQSYMTVASAQTTPVTPIKSISTQLQH